MTIYELEFIILIFCQDNFATAKSNCNIIMGINTINSYQNCTKPKYQLLVQLNLDPLTSLLKKSLLPIILLTFPVSGFTQEPTSQKSWSLKTSPRVTPVAQINTTNTSYQSTDDFELDIECASQNENSIDVPQRQTHTYSLLYRYYLGNIFHTALEWSHTYNQINSFFNNNIYNNLKLWGEGKICHNLNLTIRLHLNLRPNFIHNLRMQDKWQEITTTRNEIGELLPFMVGLNFLNNKHIFT